MSDKSTEGAPRPPWSLGALARRAGVPKQAVQRYAAWGLLGEYEVSTEKLPSIGRVCAIPADVGEHLAVALASGVVSPAICRLMRDDPAKLLAGLRALTAVAEQAVESAAERGSVAFAA